MVRPKIQRQKIEPGKNIKDHRYMLKRNRKINNSSLL